jgi:hypothetical protein
VNRERKQFLIWTTIAGVLFVFVGLHDVFGVTAIHKSPFVIVLEFIAGMCFLLNAAVQWKKSQAKDPATSKGDTT